MPCLLGWVREDHASELVEAVCVGRALCSFHVLDGDHVFPSWYSGANLGAVFCVKIWGVNFVVQQFSYNGVNSLFIF